MKGKLTLSVLATIFLISTNLAEAKPNFPALQKDSLQFIENIESNHNQKPAVLEEIHNSVDLDDEKQAEHYDAFISYRRAPSRNLAMLLKVMLERENVSAFLDVEDLFGGYWSEQLVDGILNSPNFILVLSNGTLDRARGDVNYTDFLHKEIKEAVDSQRRIILVFDDFVFPDMADYSPEIQTALSNQGITWEHALVDQSLERLMSYMMDPTPLTSNHKLHLPSRQDSFSNDKNY